MAAPVLSLRGLSVRFDTETGPVEAVKGVDLDVTPARRWPSSANPAPARARR